MSEYNSADPREAERLKKQASLFALMHRKSMDLALRRLAEPALFIDLGCGDGSSMQELGFRRMLGVDKNPKALEIASSHVDAEFMLADIEDSDFPDLLRVHLPRRPVLARLSLALHHLQDPVGTMQMLRETLPEDSVLLCLSPDQHMSCAFPEETFNRLYELWEQAPGRADDKHGRKLRVQMREAGLRNISVVPYLFTTTSVDDRKKRELLFSVFNEFRIHDWERATNDPRRAEALQEMEELLADLQQEFQRPDFFFMATMMVGLARV